MNDDLVERLRDLGIRSASLAADRIEALTAELTTARADYQIESELLKIEEALLKAAEAERDEARAKFNDTDLCWNGVAPCGWSLDLISRAEAAEADNARLRKAAIELRDDMVERAQLRMDTISGEQYRIVNAGNSAWAGFCAALTGKEPSHE